MDQIRAIVKILWGQRFWVLSIAGTLAALACWSMAASDLDSKAASRRSKIKQAFSAVDKLARAPLHPNDDVIKGNKIAAEQESKATLQIWQQLYDRQREVVLRWPTHLDPKFIAEIERLKFRDPFPNKKSNFMRSNYWNYIEKRFDGLLEIVGALKMESSRRRSGAASYGGEGETDRYGDLGARGATGIGKIEQDYLVQWLDQDDLRKQLHFKKSPTELEIWVTQEDLWVYETLLNVIASTNTARGANRPDNTAVRAIMALQVGRRAVTGGKARGNIVRAPAAGGRSASAGESGSGMGGLGMGAEAYGGYGGGSGGEYGEGGFGGGEGLGMPGGGFGGGGFGEGEGYGRGGMGEGMGEGGAGENAILAFRYLDSESGQPMEAQDTADFGNEFRQIPVRMVLMMDQKWISHVLVDCANAALPVEVKKLRINRDKSGTGVGSARARNTRSRVRGMQSLGDEESLVEVELQGVVYIYNKPDKSKLESSGDDEPEQSEDRA